MELTDCPICGGRLERGYLLGKQNRIRWSVSEKGMTVFHGVPLLRLENGFWRRWRWWPYAPSIRASRCPACRLVMLAYDNEGRENPAAECWASVVLGAVLTVCAAGVGAVSLWDWSPQPAVPLFLRILLGVCSLSLFLGGATLIGHAVQALWSRPSIQGGENGV